MAPQPMYAEHFGLRTSVIDDGIARDDRMYRGDAQQALISDIGTALCRADSVALIYGPAGAGKSTIAAAAFRESATQLALGCLPDAPQTGHELLEQLLLEFGFTPYKLSRTERLAQWRQHLAEMSATGTRIAILVEDADELRPEVLVELERLTSADVRAVSGANLLLTARQPIPGLGTESALTALCQRCRCVADVLPMSGEETGRYIRFRIERAGGDPDALLSAGATGAIHEASSGIVRMIDSVLETCLVRAAREQADRITPALVARVADGLPARPGPVETAPAASRPEPSAAGSAPADPPAVAATAAPAVETGQRERRPEPPAEGAPEATGEADGQSEARDAGSGHVAAARADNEPSLADADAGAAADVPPDVPLLDDAVIATDRSPETIEPAPPAPEALPESGLDELSVDELLMSGASGDAEAKEIPSRDADGAADIPELVDAVGPDAPAAAHGADTPEGPELSDEDRQQIEMLEAFANAEALEQISESMAETIFGNEGANDIAKALQNPDDAPEHGAADERDAAAS